LQLLCVKLLQHLLLCFLQIFIYQKTEHRQFGPAALIGLFDVG